MTAAVSAAPARPSARRAAGLILRTSVLLQIINSVAGIELARGLGVHDRGALAAALLWPLLAANVGALGVEESMTYHLAREPERRGVLVGSGLALGALQSLVFAAVAAALVPIVLSRQPFDLVVSAWIYVLVVPLYLGSVTLNSVLNGLHQYRDFNRVLLAIGLLTLAAQTLLLVLGVFSVRTVIVAYLVAQAFITAYVARLVRRALDDPLSVDRATMRRLFGYGVRSHASTVPATLNFSLDQLVISIFLTTTQLGVYVIAVTLTSFTVLVGASIAKAILPTVAAQPAGPERTLLARRLVSLTLVLSALVSLPLIALAPQLIAMLFGHSYDGAANAARILLVAAVALSTNRALEAVLRAVGRPLAAGAAEVVALGGTAVGLAILLPLAGIEGAALASLAAYLIALAYMMRGVTEALKVSPIQVLTPDRAILIALRARVRPQTTG